ncbi:hypothetical protein L1987_19410 [Smallanthus sonchifolius]|uniref:Uncharacterized protein n=1 Tax=Smallanthus sonchifolius TaxID=185202 RepID=A0ACB9IR23_9ASTR|nr:hypothetical protein L1987_19410 [Smallanthus sonchifolius]
MSSSRSASISPVESRDSSPERTPPGTPPGTPGMTDEQITVFLSMLQNEFPELSNVTSNSNASPSKMVKITYDHVRTLHKKIDDHSERLSKLLLSFPKHSHEAALLRKLRDNEV